MTSDKRTTRYPATKARVLPLLTAGSKTIPPLGGSSFTGLTCALTTYHSLAGPGTSGPFFTRSRLKTIGCWPLRTRSCKYARQGALSVYWIESPVVEGSKVFLEPVLVHYIFCVSSVKEISTCFVRFVTLTYCCLIFLLFSGFLIIRQHFVESLTTLCPLISSKILPIGRKRPQYQSRRKTGQ